MNGNKYNRIDCTTVRAIITWKGELTIGTIVSNESYDAPKNPVLFAMSCWESNPDDTTGQSDFFAGHIITDGEALWETQLVFTNKLLRWEVTSEKRIPTYPTLISAIHKGITDFSISTQ